MPKVLKIILPIIFWITFFIVVLKVDYPANITTASIFQLSSFFIPLFLALIFSINIFFNIFFSICIAFGIIILLILKSLDSLNIVSASLVIIAVLLIASYFKKAKHKNRLTPIKSGLTSHSNIPKLRSLRRRKHG